MKFSLAVALAIQGTHAFPSALTHVLDQRADAAANPHCTTSALCNKKVNIPDSAIEVRKPGQVLSQGRDNCGFTIPCVTFDPTEQYVSTKGAHRFIAPTAKQIRGPCPGLNAAANHGYLLRSGVQTIASTTNGLAEAYGMGPDFGAFLAVFSIALVGDFLSQTWSIGGPPPAANVGQSAPQGISYAHNKYESDTSIGRCDAYTNNGDAHSLSPTRFAYAYAAGMKEDRYTFDNFAFEFAKNTIRSIKTNDLYFMDPVAGTVVSPAAYDFVIAFMSNHTAETPGGYLDGKQFKSFFSIVGDYPNFKWIPGQERIPDNWYRRPSLTPYRAQDLVGDLIPNFGAYPQAFRLGGNVAGRNTYTGVNISDFTSGQFGSADELLQGNNLACFFYQALQAAALDEIKPGPALKALGPLFSKTFAFASCPKADKYNTNSLNGFKGRHYDPKGAATYC